MAENPPFAVFLRFPTSFFREFKGCNKNHFLIMIALEILSPAYRSIITALFSAIAQPIDV